MWSWENYLDLACKLIKQKIRIQSNEACWRSAISRAYYAVFHKCRDFAYRNGFEKPEELVKEHKLIPNFLINLGRQHQDVKLLKVGEELKRLRKNRNDADYKQYIDNSLKLAKASVKKANEIFYFIK